MSLSSINQFPIDPLEDIESYKEEEGYEGSFSSKISQNSFEFASKDFLKQRPIIPSSELNIIKKISKQSLPPPLTLSSSTFTPRKGKEKSSISMTNINSHKLEQLPPKSDPYELVKLCRQGWTLSKVYSSTSHSSPTSHSTTCRESQRSLLWLKLILF